jgi:hypothetical protein
MELKIIVVMVVFVMVGFISGWESCKRFYGVK